MPDALTDLAQVGMLRDFERTAAAARRTCTPARPHLLRITPGAVSQRAQAAGIVESRRARELVTDLTGRLLS